MATLSLRSGITVDILIQLMQDRYTVLCVFCWRVHAVTIMSFVPILSIEAYRAHYQLHNVMPAIHLDASLPHQYWGGIQPESLDLVVNINMIHISPFACTEVGLLLCPEMLLFSQCCHWSCLT